MRRFLDFFRTDLLRKLLALLLTVSVYISINELLKEKKSIPVSLTLTAAPGIFVPEDKRIQNVTLEVQGGPAQLQKLSSAEMAGSVTVEKENQKIKLTRDHFGSASGIRITKISPEEIDSFASISATRELPVAALGVQGSAGNGYQRESIIFDPPIVKVTGPAAEVNQLKEIRTATLINIRGNYTYREPCLLNNPNSSAIKIFPASVSVTVNIRKLDEISKKFKDIPVNLLFNHLNRDRALKVKSAFPAAVSVTLKGSKESMDKIGPGNIVLFADLRAATFEEAGTHLVSVRAELQDIPEGANLRIENIDHPQIKILIADPKDATEPKK